MHVLSEFVNVPVSIQFRQPLAVHASEEEVELSGGRKVGRASSIVVTDKQGNAQPASQLIWQGSIVKVSHEGILFATQGPSNTDLRMFLQLSDIVAITFVPEHVEFEEPKSSTPNILS